MKWETWLIDYTQIEKIHLRDYLTWKSILILNFDIHVNSFQLGILEC